MNRFIKRISAMVLAVLLIVLAGVPAMADDEPSELSGTIVVWTWDTGQHEAFADQLKQKFPNITFENVAVEGGDYLMKIQQAVASGSDLPDILYAEMTVRASMFKLDIWERLDAEPYNLDTDTFLDYIPSFTSNDRGEIIALENGVNPAFMSYKRDLAKEYLGTDDRAELEAMFATYDDYYEVGKQVYDKSGGKVTLFAGLEDVSSMLVNQSMNVSNEQDGKIVIKDKAAKIFNILAKMRDEHCVGNLSQWSSQWYASYGAKNNILFPSASWSIQYQIKPNDPEGEGNWGAFTAAGGPYSWGGTALGISKQSNVKELCWEYLRYMYTDMAGAQRSKDNIGFYLPLKEAVEDASFITNLDPYYGGFDIGTFMMKDIASAMPSISMSLYDKPISDSISLVVQAMVSDTSMTVDDAFNLFLEDLSAKMPDVEII